MITQATISIIGVLLVLVSAWGFYAVPARKQKGRALYALMILFALVHLVGDGFLRALADDPIKLSTLTLNTAGIFCYMSYLAGMILVLQIAFDIVWVKTRDKVKAGPCIILQLPSIALIVTAYAIKGTFLTALLKYMPLLYALILFFLLIWYFEKLDKGLRTGLIACMTMCILVFVANSVLKIAMIPLLVLVILVMIAFSWSGRGDLVITDVSEDELERLIEKGYVGVESDDDEISEDGVKVGTLIYTDRPKAESEEEPESELEQMMKNTSKKNVEKLSLGDDIEEFEDIQEPSEEVAEVHPGRDEQAQAARFDAPQPASVGTPSLQSESAFASQTPVQPQPQTPRVIPESAPAQATGMRSVEPSSMEQLSASVLHNRPLILEKDLNEYYHRMKLAVTGRDYDTCLEIMSEMSEYRISGIHVTRYERIRHAVVDENWSEVEKELKDY